MDSRQLDEKGLTICPQCASHYKPKLGERPKGDNRCIQVIFPNATREEREQLVTGLCSDDCWKKYLGHSSIEKKREHYVNLYRLVHDSNEGLWTKKILAMSEEELDQQIASLSARAREMGRKV